MVQTQISGAESLPVQHAQVIEVIAVAVNRGAGTEKDPVRIVNQYWSLDGRMLAETEPKIYDSKVTYSVTFREEETP